VNRNRILRTVWLEKDMVRRLANLSIKTRVQQAVLVRESLDLILKKYEKQLSRRQKKVKKLTRGTKRQGR
jgi:predicted DNA-binding protein